MKSPRILFYDVETKPVRCWLWRVGTKINVSHEQIAKGEKFDIITICYKWLGDAKIHSLDWGLRSQDSTRMIEAFSRVVETADIAVSHNGESFDIKQINTQRLLHNQQPIGWPTSEDTLRQFRRHFALPSYKLDYIAKLLTGSGKDRMSFEDWLDIVVDKNPKALAKMIRYCKRDVLKLEQIYKRASKFFTPKAHAGLIVNDDRFACPRCASIDIQGWGIVTLRSGRYQRRACKGCGHKFRSNKRI